MARCIAEDEKVMELKNADLAALAKWREACCRETFHAAGQ